MTGLRLTHINLKLQSIRFLFALPHPTNHNTQNPESAPDPVP